MKARSTGSAQHARSPYLLQSSTIFKGHQLHYEFLMIHQAINADVNEVTVEQRARKICFTPTQELNNVKELMK